MNTNGLLIEGYPFKPGVSYKNVASYFRILWASRFCWPIWSERQPSRKGWKNFFEIHGQYQQSLQIRTKPYIPTKDSNNNNNNIWFLYSALPSSTSLPGALYRVLLPQRPSQSRDVTSIGAEIRYTKEVPFILRSNISFGWDGLHNARFWSLLSGQVALGGKTGITTLSPAGIEPVPSRTAVEHTDHSTTDTTNAFFCCFFVFIIFTKLGFKFFTHYPWNWYPYPIWISFSKLDTDPKTAFTNPYQLQISSEKWTPTP